jgi:hypothetical protein
MKAHPVDRIQAPSIDTATIFCFNKRPGANSAEQAEIRHELGAAPFLNSMAYTRYGVAAVVRLPLTMHELFRGRDAARDHIDHAIAVAREHGAQYVALAGLLAALTDYGNLVAPSWADIGVTTGHATVTACVMLSIKSMLQHAGRDWPQERVAILGAGSIGMSVLGATLNILGLPREVIVCDLATQRSAVETHLERLRADNPAVRHSFCAMDRDDDALYNATLIIGSTSVANVLDIRRVVPGCLIVDDSVPNCFDVKAATNRAHERSDILFMDGGYAAFREPYELVVTSPKVLVERQGWTSGRTSAITMTGCILAPLVHRADGQASPTLGKGVPAAEVARHLKFLEQEGIMASEPSVSERVIAQFRDRYQAV